jgi:serine phosphatase RsbU (regulator of sigma subunit)
MAGPHDLRNAAELAPDTLARLSGESVTDDELLVGERSALDAFFDVANGRRLALALWVLAATLAIYAVVEFVSGSMLRGTIAGLGVIGDLTLLRFRSRPAVADNVRQTAAAVLLGHLIVLQLFHGSAAGGIGFWFVVFPLIAVRFRLASGETVALFASLYAVVAVRLVGESLMTRQAPPFLSLVLFAVFFALCFVISWALSRRLETRFVARYRSESARHRDRLRMKQELEYAREIQLSMLPRSAPRVEWLDIAALSLPATEVGGDYYDYFELDDGRLAVVVGDVTGHGVASGLVLSGVRSSLNLLRDEMARPSAVLDRVNLMLKRTSAPRMHMTLGVVVLERGSAAATVATAGHPPVLLRRANGEVVELGAGSFPLGAMAGARYGEERVDLHPGDLLLVYSDGLVEAIDPAGEQFGWGRLRRVLADLSGDESANMIRDLVLRTVWEFKGDAEQVDDVTMVVVRVDGIG